MSRSEFEIAIPALERPKIIKTLRRYVASLRLKNHMDFNMFIFMATYCSGGEGEGGGGGEDSWSCTEKLILLNSSLSVSVQLSLLFRCRQILPLYYFAWIRTGIRTER